MGTGLWVPVVASFLTFFAGPPALHPALCRASRPATRRPLLKKGAIRKLFLRTNNMFFTESQKTQKAEAVDFWVPVYGRRSMGAGIAPFLTIFAGLPPCTRRPLLKKGSIRKLFCGRATYFLWKGKESGTPEPLISGNRSMDSVRRPLCGCFVLSCRRDEVPARNTDRPSGFAFTPQKSF